MLRCRLPLAALLVAMMSASASAIDWRVMLTAEDVATLPEDAKTHYNQALRDNDVVALDAVVTELNSAAAIAEDHINLQFLLLNRSLNRARVYYGTANYTSPLPPLGFNSPPAMVAEPYLDIADQAIRRLSANGNLNAEQRRRLERQSRATARLREELATRDSARVSTGFALIEQIRADRLALVRDREETNPMDPFPSYERGINRTPDTPEDTAAAQTVDPFALLPGEVIQAFLPPPPPPPNQFNFNNFGEGAPVQLDEFGNPIAAPPPRAFGEDFDLR